MLASTRLQSATLVRTLSPCFGYIPVGLASLAILGLGVLSDVPIRNSGLARSLPFLSLNGLFALPSPNIPFEFDSPKGRFALASARGRFAPASPNGRFAPASPNGRFAPASPNGLFVSCSIVRVLPFSGRCAI